MEIIIIGIIVTMLVILLLGPKPKIDTRLKPIHLPEDLDNYLRESEAKYPDITPGAEKTIVWAND